MFKSHTMSINNQTHHNNRWPNRSFSKEEFEEDSAEGSEVKEEGLVEEEDKVVNQSSATPMGYLGIIKGSSLMHNIHTVQLAIIMLRASLS